MIFVILFLAHFFQAGQEYEHTGFFFYAHMQSVEGRHQSWALLAYVFMPVVQFIEGQINCLSQIL